MQGVLCGTQARFTAVTERVIRIEYAPTGAFEDRQSLSFLFARRLPPPASLNVSTDAAWCNVSTSEVLLSFHMAPSAGSCALYPNSDVVCGSTAHHDCSRARATPEPVKNVTVEQCCAFCNALNTCGAWVSHATRGDANDCFLMRSGGEAVTGIIARSGVTSGSKNSTVPFAPSPPGPPAPTPSRATAFFKSHGLSIRAVGADGWRWSAGDDASGNLLGTLKPIADGNPHSDLAGCCDNPEGASTGRWDPQFPIERGLLSRDGWALIDDNIASSTLVQWENSSTDVVDVWPFPLAEQRGSASGSDWYFFGCGLDFRDCLEHFTRVAGNIALPPLSGVGVWWSRHWGDESGNKAMVDDPRVGVMSESNLVAEVLTGYADRTLPLHIVVLDMEWHEMAPSPSCRGFLGVKKWGGYTWNRTLFPDPSGFATMLHARSIPSSLPRLDGPMPIELSLNYHPDSGVDNCQEHYADMGATLGLQSAVASNATLPDLDGAMSYNKTYCDAYFKYMVDPSLVDHAWTDTPAATTWSNWLYVRNSRLPNLATRAMEGINSGSNGVKTKKMATAAKRTINFSRYGGIGDHRKPSGFSGDTLRKWDTLSYEVWFTPRASNVGFGWWSHDIGGFNGAFIDPDWHTEEPELFLRWLQFATYAPVFRTHCRYCDQRVWSWSAYDSIVPRAQNKTWETMMSATLHRRNQLVPYIYSHARLRTWASGESLVTPMYWDRASASFDEAYSVATQQQYFFGRDLIVAPITAKAAPAFGGDDTQRRAVGDEAPSNASLKSFWLPATNDVWYARESMECLGAGPKRLPPRSYDLDTTPVIIRGGSAIPTRDANSTYKALANPLIWELAIGHSAALAQHSVASGNGECYEDDGTSLDYQRDPSYGLRTALAYSASQSNVSITIAASGNGFDGMPTKREQRVLLLGVAWGLVHSATCDGTTLARTVGGVPPTAKGAAGLWRDGATGWGVASCGVTSALAAHTIVVELINGTPIRAA